MDLGRFRAALRVAARGGLWKRTKLSRKWSFPWARTENPDRHIWPETLLIERYLDVKPGMTIADIGAGAGYWTFRLADAVGAGGRVLALDSDLDACLKLLYEKRRRRVENVKVRWVGRRNPRLKAASVDLVLVIDAHLFAECRAEQGRGYLRRCASALHSGGKIVIFDRAVHTAEWTPDFGKPLGYNESAPERVAALAEPALAMEALETLPIGGPGAAPGELPGYLLVLRKQRGQSPS
jgi:ubiquinone/menaquinone biosynthesis C-methylase UbiE